MDRLTNLPRLRLLTPATAPAVSVADLRAHSNISFSDDDAYLERLLWFATESVEARLRRQLMPATWVAYLDEFEYSGGWFNQAVAFGDISYAEAKTLTCIQGWADDVIVDLRPTSPTYLKHEKVILREGRGVHIPEGCANAFLTRQDMTIFHYCCSAAYHPESERGLRWNDPVLDIKWYGKPRVISAKDAGWPLWTE